MWETARAELKTISKNYAARHMRRCENTLNHLPAHLREKVDRTLTRFVAIIPTDLPPETKVALLYHVLTSEITYDKEGMDKHVLPYTYIGALCRQRAVCMGIAELFTELCRRCGVECVTVIGYACSSAKSDQDGGLHAWSIVRMSDRRWYICDPTWDLHKPNKHWKPQWFLLGELEFSRHYWIREDYPSAETGFQGKITLNRKGVDLLCRHWRNVLTQEFE